MGPDQIVPIVLGGLGTFVAGLISGSVLAWVAQELQARRSERARRQEERRERGRLLELLRVELTDNLERLEVPRVHGPNVELLELKTAVWERARLDPLHPDFVSKAAQGYQLCYRYNQLLAAIQAREAISGTHEAAPRKAAAELGNLAGFHLQGALSEFDQHIRRTIVRE